MHLFARAAAVWLVLGGGVAWADAESVCRSHRDPAARLAACSQVIDGAATTPEQKAAALRHRGTLRAAAGAHAEALADLDAALGLNPDDGAALAARGQVRLSRNDTAGALADLDAAVRRGRNADLLILRGYAYLVAERPQEAIQDFTAALDFDPKNARALNNRGLAWRKTGDLDRAIADYSSAIAIAPLYAVALNNRGYAYEAKGEKALAVADFRQALLVDPGLTGAKEGLARLGAEGRVSEESAALARAGQALVETKCGWCHATGRTGASANPAAPPLRDLHARHPLRALREPLTRGIAAPHDEMPDFALSVAEIDRIVAYINTLGSGP